MARGGTRTIMNFVRWLAPPVLTALAFAACAGATPSSSGQNPADVVGAGTAEGPSSQMSALIAADSGRTFGNDREGKLLAYGKSILTNTRTVTKQYVTAGMSCEACHLNAGTKPHGLSLVGAAARFPQWNKRAKKYITLEERLAECFLYSMNGTPPAYGSREMIALSAYVTSLSNGAPLGSKGFPGQGLEKFDAPAAPNPHVGQQVYDTKCASCHGAVGQGGGNGMFPPLWGSKSFNNGAGMHRLATMAEFVRYNMPWNGPVDALSKQESYDVSAFVLSHGRPKFDKTRTIAYPGVSADTI